MKTTAPATATVRAEYERCPSCGGVINQQTGECRCSD
jgi:hypothetical protein